MKAAAPTPCSTASDLGRRSTPAYRASPRLSVRACAGTAHSANEEPSHGTALLELFSETPAQCLFFSRDLRNRLLQLPIGQHLLQQAGRQEAYEAQS